MRSHFQLSSGLTVPSELLGGSEPGGGEGGTPGPRGMTPHGGHGTRGAASPPSPSQGSEAGSVLLWVGWGQRAGLCASWACRLSLPVSSAIPVALCPLRGRLVGREAEPEGAWQTSGQVCGLLSHAPPAQAPWESGGGRWCPAWLLPAGLGHPLSCAPLGAREPSCGRLQYLGEAPAPLCPRVCLCTWPVSAAVHPAGHILRKQDAREVLSPLDGGEPGVRWVFTPQALKPHFPPWTPKILQRASQTPGPGPGC